MYFNFMLNDIKELSEMTPVELFDEGMRRYKNKKICEDMHISGVNKCDEHSFAIFRSYVDEAAKELSEIYDELKRRDGIYQMMKEKSII